MRCASLKAISTTLANCVRFGMFNKVFSSFYAICDPAECSFMLAELVEHRPGHSGKDWAEVRSLLFKYMADKGRNLKRQVHNHRNMTLVTFGPYVGQNSYLGNPPRFI